jgi:hypothetical protein
MPDDEIIEMERLLGRSVDPRERHSVLSLDRLSEAQLAEARALHRRGTIPSILFLRFLVAGLTLRDAQDFADKVLRGDAPMAAWQSGPTLYVVSLRLEELLGVTARAVEDRLAAVEGERWRRIAPSSRVLSWASALGAPAVLAHTPVPAPAGTESLILPPTCQSLEPVPDLVVGVRRWLAALIAHYSDSKRTALPLTADAVLSRFGDPGCATADVRAAAHGLLRERDAGYEPDQQPLGFRGPDEWYA